MQMKSDRVYLSGAVTGTDDAAERFAEWEKVLASHGYEVVNPFHICKSISSWEHEEIMKVCFELLSHCGKIFFMPGWEKSRGANQECGFAFAHKIEVLHYEMGAFWSGNGSGNGW